MGILARTLATFNDKRSSCVNMIYMIDKLNWFHITTVRYTRIVFLLMWHDNQIATFNFIFIFLAIISIRNLCNDSKKII